MLLGTRVQLVVFCTVIEIQIVFEILLIYSSPVNLLLLASLEERSTCRELDCFLGVENNMLEGDNLVDKAARSVFVLFLEAITLLAEETLPCF